MRIPRTAIAGVVAAAVLLIAASSASAFISTLASTAYSAYTKVSDCLANQKVNQPCLASQSANIRALHTKVDALQRTIDANHVAVMARFDQVENLLNQQNLSGYADQLRTLDVNGSNALRAWNAMLACMIASAGGGTTCGAYIGGAATEAPQDTSTAIKETLAYLQRQIAFLPTNIDATATYYTGTQVREGVNGAAYWSWWSALRQQDQAVGVSRGQTNARVPVIAPDLARITRQDTEYYANIFQQYGYLMVLGAQLNDDSALARSNQATVNRAISGTARYSVMGTVNRYHLPGLTDGTMIVLHDGRALKVSTGHRLARPMDADAVRTVGRVLNGYGGVDRFAAAFPNALGPERWYGTRQHIRHRTIDVRTCLGSAGCAYRAAYAVNELADSGATCTVRMRPWGDTPGWEGDQEYWMRSDPAMGNNFFWNSYRRYVTGPANYDWERRHLTGRRTTYHFGFGSWVRCTEAQPGTQQVMTQTPAMLG